MNFVCVDAGASSTRFASCKGKPRIMQNGTIFVTKDNGEIDMQPVELAPVLGDSIEPNLELIITKLDSKNVDNIFPAHVLIGAVADRYNGVKVIPDGLSNKTTQRINFTSIIASITRCMIEDGIDPNVELYIALPPTEAEFAKERVNEVLVGSYLVQLPMYDKCKDVRFNIVKTTCYEESSCALVSFLFRPDGQESDNYEKYADKAILSMDIGASTTDIFVSKNGTILENSGYTIKIGGNNVKARAKNLIQGRLSFDPGNTYDEMIITEGRVKKGNKKIEITDIISRAKLDTAIEITSKLKEYFTFRNIKITDIDAIVVSGGGSMGSQYINDAGVVVQTSAPMTDYITQALQGYCDVDVVNHSKKPRHANILGLFIRARFDDFKEQAAQGLPVEPVAQPTPVAQAKPAYVAPVEPVAPVQVAPVQAAPVQAAPVQAPVQAAPVQAPVQAPPVEAVAQATPVVEQAAPVQTPVQAPVQAPVATPAPVTQAAPIQTAPVEGQSDTQ